MSRWLVQIGGKHFDIEEFPYWFPNGDIYAIEENKSVYLVGSAFEKFSEASQVHEAAIQAVDEFSGIIKLLCSSFQIPKVGHVFREDANGKRSGFIFASGSITFRIKTHATPTVSGKRQSPKSQTQAQTLLSGSRTNNHLRAAMFLWADSLRTWPRLYRVLEEIEQYLGHHVDKSSFCSNHQRKRFTCSANTAEISGKDARHAIGKFKPPNHPMKLSEATTFIGGLLQKALAHAAG